MKRETPDQTAGGFFVPIVLNRQAVAGRNSLKSCTTSVAARTIAVAICMFFTFPLYSESKSHPFRGRTGFRFLPLPDQGCETNDQVEDRKSKVQCFHFNLLLSLGISGADHLLACADVFLYSFFDKSATTKIIYFCIFFTFLPIFRLVFVFQLCFAEDNKGERNAEDCD